MSPHEIADLVDRTVQAQDQKFTAVVIVLLLFSMPSLLSGIFWVLRSIIAGRNDSGKRRDQIIAQRLEAERKAEDDKRRQDELEVQANTKQQQGLIGVLSQLADQGAVSQTMTQQTMAMADRLIQQLDSSQKVNAGWAEGITERNKIQEKTNLVIQANTEAILAFAPSVGKAVGDAVNTALDEHRKETRQDQTHWVEGMKAEMGGPIATVTGVLERQDKTLTQLAASMDALPDKVAEKVTSELRDIAATLSGSGQKLAELSDSLNTWFETHTEKSEDKAA